MLSKEKVVFFSARLVDAYYTFVRNRSRCAVCICVNVNDDDDDDRIATVVCTYCECRYASRTQMLLDKGLYKNYMFMHVLHRGNQLKESLVFFSAWPSYSFFCFIFK